MIPRRLRSTALGGAVRTIVRSALALPLVGRVVDLLINRVLLPVVRYHVLVGFKR